MHKKNGLDDDCDGTADDGILSMMTATEKASFPTDDGMPPKVCGDASINYSNADVSVVVKHKRRGPMYRAS